MSRQATGGKGRRQGLSIAAAPFIDHITGLLQSVTGIVHHIYVANARRVGAVGEVDTQSVGVDLPLVGLLAAAAGAARSIHGLDHDGGDFAIRIGLVPNLVVVVLLDRVDIGGRDGLTVGADHEDLALIGNTDRGAGKGDGAVDNSVILVRGIGGHILHRGVSSAGSDLIVGIIAGNQAVDALAVLGQLAGDGSGDLVRSGSGHLDLGDLTANDGVILIVITKLLGVVDRGIAVLIALDEEHALGVAADHSVTVVGDKDDLGGRRAVRHVNGAIVISIGQIDGGNVRNTDVRLDGVRSLIVNQERGLAVGIGRTVLTDVVLIVAHRSVALGDQNTGGFGGLDRRNLSQNVFLVGIDAVGNNVVQLSRTPGLDVNDLAGAVKEEQLGLGGAEKGAGAGSGVAADHGGISIGGSRRVNINGIAVEAEINIDGGVHRIGQRAADRSLGSGNRIDLIGRAAGHNRLALNIAGKGAGDLLGELHALHAGGAGHLGVGVEHIIVNGISVVGLIGAAKAGIAGAGEQDISVLRGRGLVGRRDLSEIGVDHSDGGGVLSGIIPNLSQSAVAADLIEAALNNVLGESGLFAIDIVGNVARRNAAVGQTEVGIDGAELDGVSILGIFILGILTDLLGVVGPNVNGTAKIIHRTGGELQLGVELLAQLDGVTAVVGQGRIGDGLLLGNGVGHIGGLGSAEVDLSTVDGDAGALGGVLNGGGLEGVQSHLSGLLTGEDLIDGAVDLVHQLGLGHELAGVDGPVGADHAGGLGIVAELNEQHLAELQSSQLTGGVELAVADTVDDAGLRAVADKAGGPARGSHVGKGSAAHEGVSSLGTELEVRDDLRGLLTGQVFLGIKIALFIANEHTNGVHDVNSFLVVDLVGIFESCVADGDEGHGHDQRQHQSE